MQFFWFIEVPLFLLFDVKKIPGMDISTEGVWNNLGVFFCYKLTKSLQGEHYLSPLQITTHVKYTDWSHTTQKVLKGYVLYCSPMIMIKLCYSIKIFFLGNGGADNYTFKKQS